MALILSITGGEIAGEDVRKACRLEGDRILIGRSKNCDWTLPDPSNVVSSRHAELSREGSDWRLKDISTNGTFLNGAAERMGGEHILKEGDRIRIGSYELVAALAEDVPEATAPPVAEPPVIPPVPAAEAPPPSPVAEAKPAETKPAETTWADTTSAETPAASGEAEPDEVPENVTVMWDSLADINKVDWERGGLGVRDEGAPVAADTASISDLLDAFVAATALDPKDLDRSPDLVRKAGALLKRLVSGLVVMVEARARAKAQMGAEATGLELEGNNPIKFARSPEQALARLLSPPEPGFMEADRAVEDAFLDLQSHQVATLRAIPGALRATLDRFSPGAIRRRAEAGAILSRIVPAFQDAALWRNYEREYVKVKNESDEAFMQVFSREFRRAYDRQLREGFDKSKR